jgi:hypothetical protein
MLLPLFKSKLVSKPIGQFILYFFLAMPVGHFVLYFLLAMEQSSICFKKRKKEIVSFFEPSSTIKRHLFLNGGIVFFSFALLANAITY